MLSRPTAVRSFVIIVDWDRPRGEVELADRLLAVVSPVAPKHATAPHIAVAYDGASGLVAGGDGRIVLACGRLDNRAELASELGLGRDASFEDVVAALWSEGRPSPASRLEGDFALALWSPVERRLELVRDAFGARPLYHRREGSRFLAASHLEALLAPPAGGIPQLDEAAVLDLLTVDWNDEARTLYRGIRRAPAGNVVTVSSGASRQERHFVAPATLERVPSAGEVDDALRAHFDRAVARRLVSDRPVLVHLSGGLDSTSVAFSASRLSRTASGPMPSISLFSAVFPGRANDESERIDASAAKLPFPSLRRDGRAVDWRALERFDFVGPSRPVGRLGDVEAAHECGAGVILSGFGADELLREGPIFRDLWAHWRFADLAQLLRGELPARRRAGLRHATVLLPARVRAHLRALRPPEAEAPPSWLARGLRGSWPPRKAQPLASTLGSETERATWWALTRPVTALRVELDHRWGELSGLEYRHPWLDLALVRFVLSLPWEARIPWRGAKTLERRALGLPGHLTERRMSTPHGDGPKRTLAEELTQLRSVVASGPWCSEPFVERAALLARIDEIVRGQRPPSHELGRLWHVALLERWLRWLDTGTTPANHSFL